MKCKHNTADGCKAYPHRKECIGKVCECFVPEENYQAYIDDLHKEIDKLLDIVTEQKDKLDEYEQTILKAFKKWSEI